MRVAFPVNLRVHVDNRIQCMVMDHGSVQVVCSDVMLLVMFLAILLLLLLLCPLLLFILEKYGVAAPLARDTPALCDGNEG